MRNESNQTLVMTGASGYLGGHFLRQVLKSSSFDVICLARSKNGQTARQRVKKNFLRSVFAYHGSEDSFDLFHERDNFSRVFVGEESLSKASNVSAFLHFAARLSPEKIDRQAGDRFENVHLICAAIKQAAAIKANRFVLISTGYIGGENGQTLPNELISRPDKFRNTYEESKWEAEHAAFSQCRELSIPLLIIRPPIITGPSNSQLDMLRTPLGKVQTALKSLQECGEQSEIGSYMNKIVEDAALDILPVDHASLRILESIRQQSECDLEIINLQPACKLPALHLAQNMLAEDSVASSQVKNLGVQLSKQILDFYLPYVCQPHTSLFTNTAMSKGEGEAELYNASGYLASINREIYYGTLTDCFVLTSCKMSDGVELIVFDAVPDVEPHGVILFCNALSMPSSILQPLAEAARKAGFRFISWETRNFPRLSEDKEDEKTQPLQHASDGVDIAIQLGLEKVILAGWSTGALIAGLASVQMQERVRAVHFLAGSFMMPGTCMTPFQKNMKNVMARAGKSYGVAKQMYRLAFSKPSETNNWLESLGRYLVQAQTRKILQANDDRLDHITRQAMQNERTAYQYARQISGYVSFSDWELLKVKNVPAYFWHAQDDEMAHISGARKLAESLNGQTHFYPSGGHFQLYQDRQFLSDFVSLLLKDEKQSVKSLEKQGRGL